MITIRTGGLVVKGPLENEVYLMDWGSEHLAAGVTISTSTWVRTLKEGVATGLMTIDNQSIPTGNRTTQVRCVAGTEGQRYDLTNTIVTNETPARTKDRSFTLLVQDR